MKQTLFGGDRRHLLKYSLLGMGAVALFKKFNWYLNRDETFQTRMKLIFPHYYLQATELEAGKKVKIVSENQLEHVIKLCNLYGKSVRSVNDNAISAYKGINILLDYSEFNHLKKINIKTQKVKLEPGLTFSELNK